MYIIIHVKVKSYIKTYNIRFMEYKCNICNKFYKTYQSMWIHNKKYHPPISSKVTLNNSKITTNKTSQEENENKYVCELCGKSYKYSQGKWKHKKTCKPKNEKNIQDLQSEIQELKKEMDILKTTNKSKIIKNYNNGTVVNGNIITGNVIKNKITKIGNENVLELNDKEVTDIFNKEISSLL